jgi:TatD DNase family protein
VSIFIDAHFHLDRAAKAMLAGQEGHWTDQVRTVLHQREGAAKLSKCVASFCDSATHAELVANPEILTELAKDPRLYFSFGVHPKEAERWVKERTPNGVTLDAARLLNLRQLLGGVPKVVGIGEMGLDFSVGNGERWDVQRLVMEKVLEATADIIRTRRLPIVVHCREAAGASLLQPDELTREIVCRVLGPDHPVQVHYFRGRDEALQAWRQHNNVVFSIPAGTTHQMGAALLIRLKRVPRDRILLETDAPYAPPPKHGRVNTPFSIAEVHPAVAAAFHCTVAEFLQLTAENADRFFSF